MDNNTVFLDHEYDYEQYLVYDGYKEELVMALDSGLGINFFNEYKRKNNGNKNGRKATDEKCPECNQNIYVDQLKNYAGDEGEYKALIDCLHDNKTAYSPYIADIIINNTLAKNKIPKKIEELFIKMNHELNIK